MKIDLTSRAAKLLIGLSIVLGVLEIFKSGYKAGKWLHKKTNDQEVVANVAK